VSHLPINRVCHVAALAQAALLKKFGKSDVYDFFAAIGNRLSAWILQIIAQLLVRSWDNGWDNRRGSTRDRIALKRRQRNDLVGFELFFRSQTLYPTELRARSETLHCQQFTASSSSISTSSFGSF